jgi:hypothetical protein
VLALSVSAPASGSAVPVALKVLGSTDRDVGQSVKLTATAKLPRSGRLVILGTPTGKPTVKVAECLRSPCTGTFRDRSVEVVDFRASVIKRTGSRTATLGRSKKISVSWSEPAKPTPPAVPAAVPGHYEGRSTLNEIFNFDVSADGRSLTNLQTGQVNESCDPSAHIAGGNINAPGPFPIALDGSFSISGTINGTIGAGDSYTRKIVITGHSSGGTASGTLRTDTSFSISGTAFTCNSGDQTWTATKTG